MGETGSREVAPGIHRIETTLGERVVCTYALIGDVHVLLYDTGMIQTPATVVQPYLSSLGLPIDRIDYALVSHADLDHSGGTANLRQLAPDITLMCHVADRHLIEDVDLLIDRRYGQFAADHGIDDPPTVKAELRNMAAHVPVDLGLSGGEKLRLGRDWEVLLLHTPGHSSGSMSIYDPRSRSALISDAVLSTGLITEDGRPAFPPTYRFVDAYLGSIQMLSALEIDFLLTGHYPVMSGRAARDFLAESRSYVDRVDFTLRQELVQAKRALSTKELIGSLRPRLGTWPPEAADSALAFPLVGHLEQLESMGAVETSRIQGAINWRWRD